MPIRNQNQINLFQQFSFHHFSYSFSYSELPLNHIEKILVNCYLFSYFFIDVHNVIYSQLKFRCLNCFIYLPFFFTKKYGKCFLICSKTICYSFIKKIKDFFKIIDLFRICLNQKIFQLHFGDERNLLI